jgi:hypothetical protein
VVILISKELESLEYFLSSIKIDWFRMKKISCLLFMCSMHFLTINAQDLSAGLLLIYPKSLEEIKTFEKTEIGITFPADLKQKVFNYLMNARVEENEKRNPFVSWSLRYSATFTHSSGETIKVEGFYYQEFSRLVE